MTCCSSQTEKTHAASQNAITSYGNMPMKMIYSGRHLRAGFHITEVKRLRIESIDCGANSDNWSETVIQLLDVEGEEENRMTADKFLSILSKTGNSLTNGSVIVEAGRPGEAMQLYDVVGLTANGVDVTLSINPRQAVCKPTFVTLGLPLNAVSEIGTASATRCCG
jgi:hypothetical protein